MTAPSPAKKRGWPVFQTSSSRKPLSRDAYLYWADILPKIIKVGTEFEANLPDLKDVFGQMSSTITCAHKDRGCAEDCAHLDDCLVDRHPALCYTRNAGAFMGKKFQCPAKDASDVEACKTCPAWALDCKGLQGCAMFTSACGTCPSFARVGKALPEDANIRFDATTVRASMKQKLEPTEYVGQVGNHGVLEVKKDGSLLGDGGVEIPTVGRRVHWGSFYRMCSEIIQLLVEHGGYVNERSGQHYHLLAGYLPSGGRRDGMVSELEVPMPEIILANLHQLHRRYELAMFWITACGAEADALTRWARYRQSIFKYSALRQKMAGIQGELAGEIICMNGTPKDGKYASVAYHFCRFDNAGDVSTFHFENRIADGALSPAVVAAWAMLFYAMIMKAVRLSQYGIMEVGDAAYIDKVKEIKPFLIDGERREWNGSRKADTSKLAPHYDWLRNNALEMVNFLKPELSGLGPAYSILMRLAETPCAFRLMNGQNWAGIEEDLMREHRTGEPEDLPEELRELVDLSGIIECRDVEEWIEEAAGHLGAEPSQVADAIHRMINTGHYRWSSPLGAVITV